MTFGLYNPLFVINTAFHQSDSFIKMLYPHLMSIFEKYLDPFSLVMRSDMSGIGYAFGFVCSFRYQ